MVPTERLGIMGGTFDPVHVAHVVAAVEAHAVLALDRTLLVVARDPWQKRERELAPAELRFAMVEATIAGLPGLEASRLELERPGPTYTIDTVEALRGPTADAPRRDLFLILGADAAANIATWHRADELQKLVTLAVVTREGHETALPHGWDVRTVPIPRLDISSSDIRDRVAAGRPIDGLVPAPAVRVIRSHGLYTRS